MADQIHVVAVLFEHRRHVVGVGVEDPDCAGLAAQSAYDCRLNDDRRTAHRDSGRNWVKANTPNDGILLVIMGQQSANQLSDSLLVFGVFGTTDDVIVADVDDEEAVGFSGNRDSGDLEMGNHWCFSRYLNRIPSCLLVNRFADWLFS